MGLTLNTNSLTIPSTGSSAASGVSTADVTTLIKNNTPYQYITKVDAAGSSTILCSNVFSSSDGFSAYRIIVDGCITGGNGTSYLNMRYEEGGSIITSSIYGWSAIRHYGTSGPSGTYETNDTQWKMMPSITVNGGYHGFIDLVHTDENLNLQAMWNFQGGTSTRNAGVNFGGGRTSNQAENTGFNIRSSQTFTGGSVRIYGVNNV